MNYEGVERTGIKEIDDEIDRLRSERDSASRKQAELQNKIDELFLDSMIPEIHPGDYIRYTGDEVVTLGKVQRVRRRFSGVSIEFDIVSYIQYPERSNRIVEPNPKITVVDCRNWIESITVHKDDLCKISKITREEFLGQTRIAFDSVLSASSEPQNENQLKFNF